MHRPAILAVLLLLAAGPATAQDPDDACTQRSPCDWFVTVDALGFVDEPAGGWNFTRGDWFRLTVLNLADRPHRVEVDGLVAVDAESESVADSAPFQWPEPGTYWATDEPSGDRAAVEVLDLDVVAITQTGGDDHTSIPAASVAVGVLVAVAAGLRRR